MAASAPAGHIAADHHLQGHAVALLDLSQELAPVALVHPAVLNAGEAPPVQAAQQPASAVTVADIGGGDVGLADQPEGVDQQVPLTAVEPLGAVVAVRPPLSVRRTLWLSRITAPGSACGPAESAPARAAPQARVSHTPCRRHTRQ